MRKQTPFRWSRAGEGLATKSSSAGLAAVAFLTILGTAAVPGSARSAEAPILLRWGTLAPQGTAYTDALEAYKSYLERESGGRLKNLLYVGGVVGDEPDMIKKLRIGQLDVGGFTMKGTHAALEELCVFGLPFMFESYEEADFVLISLFDDIDRIMQRKGFKLVELVEEGFDLLASRDLVSLPDGLKNQRVWVWGSDPVGLATYKALGVESPIGTPVPEVLPALQTGLLNVVTASPLAAVGLQWSSVIRYIYDFNLYYDPGVVLMTKSKWDALPQDIKDLVARMRRELGDYFFQLERPDQDRSLEGMIKHGIQVVRPDAATLKKLEERTRPVWDELADKVYPRDLLEKVIEKKKEWAALKAKGAAKPLRKKGPPAMGPMRKK